MCVPFDLLVKGWGLVLGDHEKRPHGVQVVEGGSALGHLNRGDTNRPHVSPLIVGSVAVLGGDNLGGHPVRMLHHC